MTRTRPLIACASASLLMACGLFATKTSPGARALTRDGAVFELVTFTPATSEFGSNHVVITSMASHPEGGLVIAGTTSSKLTLSPRAVAPGSSVFVARLSRAGEVMWARGSYGEHPVVTAGPDGRIYAALYTSAPGPLRALTSRPGVKSWSGGDATLALHALTSGGEPLWTSSPKTPGGGLHAEDLEVFGDRVLVVGQTYSTFKGKGWSVPTIGGTDAHMSWWSADDGEMLSARAFGGARTDTARAAAITEDGGVVLAGSFEGEITFGEWTLNSKGNDDGYITRIDADGGVSWARQISSDASRGGFARVDLLEPQGDGWVAAGTFAHSIDMGRGPRVPDDGSWRTFVMGIGPDGATRWDRPITGEREWSEPVGLAVMPDGSAVVSLELHDSYGMSDPSFLAVGTMVVRNPSGQDTLLVRLSPERGVPELIGHWSGERRRSELDGNVSSGPLINHDGALVGAGTFTGSAAFGSRRLEAPFGVWDPCQTRRDDARIRHVMQPPRDPCEPEEWVVGVAVIKRIE